MAKNRTTAHHDGVNGQSNGIVAQVTTATATTDTLPVAPLIDSQFPPGDITNPTNLQRESAYAVAQATQLF